MLGKLQIDSDRINLLEMIGNQELSDEFMEDLIHGNTFSL
jgi:hypothetical protein